jgi:hypothetical protein
MALFGRNTWKTEEPALPNQLAGSWPRCRKATFSRSGASTLLLTKQTLRDYAPVDGDPGRPEDRRARAPQEESPPSSSKGGANYPTPEERRRGAALSLAHARGFGEARVL